MLYIVKGFYPKWTSDKITAPASEWAVSEMNVSDCDFFF